MTVKATSYGSLMVKTGVDHLDFVLYIRIRVYIFFCAVSPEN